MLGPRTSGSNRVEPSRAARLLAVVALAVGAWAARPAAADWPAPAIRSGSQLPPPRVFGLAIEGAGAYVPQVRNLSAGATGVGQGSLVWNLALFENVGLFGRHYAEGMWWANVSLLNLGSEAGLRARATRLVAMEFAYLGHRAEKQWVDGRAFALGGVRDHGLEAGVWLTFEPLARLRLEPHLFGRYFRVYKDDQGVLGLGLRTSILLFDGHALVLELETMRTQRGDPRDGVDRVTWNVKGTLQWRSTLTGSFGIMIGARVSTNLLVGEVPMLELKRSMIDEPMAMATLGFYFGI